MMKESHEPNFEVQSRNAWVKRRKCCTAGEGEPRGLRSSPVRGSWTLANSASTVASLALVSCSATLIRCHQGEGLSLRKDSIGYELRLRTSREEQVQAVKRIEDMPVVHPLGAQEPNEPLALLQWKRVAHLVIQ
eukprot:m.213650 g.213650  ORF g.213650 m.213650 type:complete len:134 (+) comp54041_c0_seq3:287-688(+)